MLAVGEYLRERCSWIPRLCALAGYVLQLSTPTLDCYNNPLESDQTERSSAILLLSVRLTNYGS